MKLGWVSGRILLVEQLSPLKWRELEIEPKVYTRLLGGRGLAAYLAYKLIPPRTQPLSPRNCLIIAPGLMVGSGLTTASKTIFAAKSPLTGFLGRAAAGARLGWQLRRLGYDGLVVCGSLDEPGILVVDDGGPRVEPASRLWGLRISEARRELARSYPGYAECVIGPAGENLSRISSIDCNGRQAGRTGLGAVMGSKKLKAILVKGAKDPKPANAQELRKLVDKWARELPKHPASRTLIEYGTPAMAELTGTVHGVLPSLNWRRSSLDWCPNVKQAVEELARWAPRYRVSRNPCPHCNRVCSQVVEVRVPGEGVRRVDGPEYETVYALGTNLGFCSFKPAAVLGYLADEYGFDTISLGVTLSWAIEALERGDLKPEDLGGVRLEWGRLDTLVEAVKMMAERRGKLGQLLADGVKAAVERVGRGYEYAMHVKGLELPAYDGRGLKGMALGYAVSSRGGDHLTSGAYAVEVPGRLWVYRDVDPRTSAGKGVLVKEMEDLMALYDALGVCKFSRYALTPEPLSEIASALLGVELSPGDLLLAGERIVNLERLYNLREGLSPADDTLPARMVNEPIEDGPCRGCRLSSEELEAMKREYYASRGWSPQTGKPTMAKLVQLGLTELIEIDEQLVERSV
jgi:aldehyde:ferredoxin oxidoreductase